MILITGAGGFIGGALTTYLVNFFSVRALVRSFPMERTAKAEYISGIDLATDFDLRDALSGVKTVIHCAGRVHVTRESSTFALDAFRQVNVKATMQLAAQASKAGVKRFIYFSSIKVNGESTSKGLPFTHADKPCPENPYALSKLEAELALQELSIQTGMEVTIIRPALVYGCGVKANFLSLIRLIKLGLPLPFGLANQNLRSFVAIDNLISFTKECIEHPNAANQIFLVSDGCDISTASLIREIASASNRPIIMLPIPIKILRMVLGFCAGSRISDRLLGNLQVDNSKCYDLINWTPVVSLKQALQEMMKKSDHV